MQFLNALLCSFWSLLGMHSSGLSPGCLQFIRRIRESSFSAFYFLRSHHAIRLRGLFYVPSGWKDSFSQNCSRSSLTGVEPWIKAEGLEQEKKNKTNKQGIPQTFQTKGVCFPSSSGQKDRVSSRFSGLHLHRWGCNQEGGMKKEKGSKTSWRFSLHPLWPERWGFSLC